MRTLVVLVALTNLVARTQAAADDTLVLDENGYFRIYCEFGLMRISSDALKAEGERLLGDGRLARLEKETRQHLKDRDINWEVVDWRDHACAHFRRTQLGDDTRAVEMIPTVPPPGDWMKLDFDDASWLRQRLGRLPTQRYMMEAYEFTSHLIRALHLRTYFHVPEPPRAGELSLGLAFRGGARVFVNGVEIARSHLPRGDLGPDAHADDYPREAYLALPDEVPEARYSGTYGEIRYPWDQGTPATRHKRDWVDFRLTASRQPINRKGWDRLMDLRDRKLTGIRVPARLLRQGPNVLAVEIRGARFHPQILQGAGNPRADNWARHGGTENHTWDHARLLSLQLRSTSSAIPSALARPSGVQVWAEDMHTRVYSRDYNPPGFPAGTIRIVGAPNGTFAGQVVVGTGRELTGLRASVSDLKGAHGAGIPASAARLFYLKGHSLLELFRLGQGRCLGMYHWDCPMAVVAVNRYQVRLANPPEDGGARERAMEKLLSKFAFFDHLAAEAPQAVPGGTCQPIWLSLQVPADATPGVYRGSVEVRAEGMGPVAVPLEVEVMGWRIPGPLEFQTIVQSEQSPYAVAKAHEVALWSDEHWRLMEVSFRQLARLGADWVFVPALLRSEFGNREDGSMIRWIRTQEGKLKFGYAILDRYLDLAVKHWGTPRVVCFQIMHGCPSKTSAVKILDEATGKEEEVDVGPNAASTRRPLWRAFATSLLEHMRERGMESSMYWGHAFDMILDPGLVDLMREFTPSIRWAAGAHGRKPDPTFHAVARAYGSDITDRSLKGWKNPFIHLVMPRTNGSVICVEGTSTPYTYRVLSDRAIYSGFNGIGRMGADYYDRTWFDGFRGGQYLLVGRSCVQTLWPGPNGAESSARNEAMLEGIQEAEARIFMEQALDRGILPQDQAAEAQKVLDDHFRATLHIPGGTAAITMMDYTGDWQARSRRLFATAARVAQAVGIDVDRTQIGAEKVEAVFDGQAHALHGRGGVALPALGTTRVSVKLRNWTSNERAWRAAATQPWIQPGKTEGTLVGQEELPVTLDGKALEPGKTVAGNLIITDVASGRSYPVAITARVVKPFEFVVEKPVFNVTVGQSASRDFLLVNRTASAQPWRIESSVPWLQREPGAGTLASGASTFVKLLVRPGDRDSAVRETQVTLVAAGGAVNDEFTFKTFVIPRYHAPAAQPNGQPVPLETVSQQLLVRHRHVARFRGRGIQVTPHLGATWDFWHGPKPLIIGEKTYKRGLWALPRHETVYKLEGTGLTAFSAEVGWNAIVAKSECGAGHDTIKLNFEIHVDGQARAQSGLMSATDSARLLVVENLAAAKEIKLVTRTDFDGDDRLLIAYGNWADPTFYKGD